MDPQITQVTIANFRCFHDLQDVELAPLTLLIGDNSTGKTSFLAMLRALYDAALAEQVPDFKEPPYDMGSFDEVAHFRGGKAGRARSFEGSFKRKLPKRRSPPRLESIDHWIKFAKSRSIPLPAERWIDYGRVQIHEYFDDGALRHFKIATPNGEWRYSPEGRSPRVRSVSENLIGAKFWAPLLWTDTGAGDMESLKPTKPSAQFSAEDQQLLMELDLFGFGAPSRPIASAPVRSRPKRTYDPFRHIPDPEGDYVPMYLANLFHGNRQVWQQIKEALQEFGRSSRLFDDIDIRPLGRNDSEPFQVQIRKEGKNLKGPKRNLVDMGYGVSQVLPVLLEIFRRDGSDILLLQQPEVHLHPSAQAALGSLFCDHAVAGKQLVVETHSDYLLDRIRILVRDGEHAIQHNDVSILFFERRDLDVVIHSIRLDKDGNVTDPPDTYRDFFRNERLSLLGL